MWDLPAKEVAKRVLVIVLLPILAVLLALLRISRVIALHIMLIVQGKGDRDRLAGGHAVQLERYRIARFQFVLDCVDAIHIRDFGPVDGRDDIIDLYTGRRRVGAGIDVHDAHALRDAVCRRLLFGDVEARDTDLRTACDVAVLDELIDDGLDRIHRIAKPRPS